MSIPAADPGLTTSAVRDLVVSYCFPPYVDEAAMVSANRVRQGGRPVDVIHNAMDALRPRHPRLEDIADGLVHRRVALPTFTSFNEWHSIRDFTEEGVRCALGWDRERGGYQRVYSPSHFAASHFLAARFVLDRPHIIWTAEFSDPLSHDVTGSVRTKPIQSDPLTYRLAEGLTARGIEPPISDNLYEWSEILAFGLADRIVFSNEHLRTFMLRALRDDGLRERVLSKSVVSLPPTLDAEFYKLGTLELDLDPTRSHIAYFGNFYATPEMESVLSAIRVLPKSIRQRLQLRIFTGQTKVVERTVSSLRLGDVVRVCPPVNYLDFLSLTRRFDALVVHDSITSPAMDLKPLLPAKWSDYRGSGTPLWGVVEEGSVLSMQQLDYRSPVGHATAAIQVLSQIAARNDPIVGDVGLLRDRSQYPQ